MLRQVARRLYEQSVECDHYDRFSYDEDDELDWDDDDTDGEFGPEDVAEVIPPEMIDAYRLDPKRFEREMRKTMPKSVIDVVLPVLREIAKRY